MITMTESAARNVANFLSKRGKGIGIRLGVKTSGCSGMAYKLEFVDVADIEVRELGVDLLQPRPGSKDLFLESLALL